MNWTHSTAGRVIVVCLLALVVRSVGLGTFMTADEENWMLRSAGFWHSLFHHHDPGGTFMTTHPGATLMWLAGGGIVVQEARLGFDIDTSNLALFRVAATLPVTLATVALVGVTTRLLIRRYGHSIGIVSGGLLAVEPYLVGMSQVVHLDMLLGLFMVSAALAFWQAIGHVAGRWSRTTIWYLLLAGVLTGLALATKLLPALWLFVFMTAVLAWHLWWQRTQWGLFWHTGIRALGFVFGVAMLTFHLSWPVLWFQTDVLRSFSRDVPTIITDEHVALEISEEPIAPQSFYLRTLLGRVTPPVMLLTLLTLIVAALPAGRRWRQDVIGWAFFTLGFLFLITFVAKKADRYAVPALMALPLISSFGVVVLWRMVSYRRHRYYASVIVPVIVLGVLMALTLRWAPYTIAYNNPLFPNVRPLSQQGWGEGLDAAAAWLNDQPKAAETYTVSWYPSVTDTFTLGPTLSLSSRTDYRVAYVVLYRNMGGRAPDDMATNVLEEFQDATPVHTIAIGGVPYVWIYETRSVGNFNRHVGEVTGEREVGQTVIPTTDTWSAIDIGFATFSSRANTKDVILHVRQSLTATEDLRTVRINAHDIIDNEWQRFTFEPITNAAGREFYVAITSPESVPGDAVTVRYLDADVRPGQMALNGELKPGDIAYQLPLE